MVFKYFFDGVVGWLETWGLKLISTQVVVEVEVGVELGNKLGLSCVKLRANLNLAVLVLLVW